jgi:hypothetical protein
MAQAPKLLQHIEDKFGIGGIALSEITFGSFQRALYLTTMQIEDGTNRGFTLHDHLMPPEAWLLSPKSRDDQNNLVEQPRQLDAPIAPALIIDPDASQALRALVIQEHSAALKEFLRLQVQHKEHTSLIRMIKVFLCSDHVVGEATAANNRGDGIEMVTAMPRTIFAKVTTRFGTPSAASAQIMSAWYDIQFTQEPTEYFRLERELTTDLTRGGHQRTENQRMASLRAQFASRPEMSKVFDLFDTMHPDESQHSLAIITAFVLAQENNIRKAMTRADLYPPPAGMAAQATPPAEAASAEPNAAAAYSATQPTPRMYTHDEVAQIALNAVQAACATHGSAPPPASRGASARRHNSAPHNYESPGRPSDTYCYHHSNSSHPSGGCNAIRDGMPTRHALFDSRNDTTMVDGVSVVVHDATRVYGHRNCRHTPRCISAADAKRATGPFHFPAMPGNRYPRPPHHG